MKQTIRNTSVNGLIIKLFNAAIADGSKTDFAKVNKFAVTLGYLVHPDVCTTEVLEYLKSESVNYGSTFYKQWTSVINKDRFELFLDQIRHYASTYGTNHEGPTWTPDETSEVPAFTTFKMISSITKEEVIARIEKMLFSGIALTQGTIEDILIIARYLKYKFDVNKVKNKEAKMILFKETGTVPNDAVEMVRYLSYLATGKTLLIKNKFTFHTIKTSTVNIGPLVEQFGYEKLATVFHRFKPLFLAFKSSRMVSSDYFNSLNRRKPLTSLPESNNAVVNRLRKLADKFHKPMQIGFFEGLLAADEKVLPTLITRVHEITNFKKILLLQTINIRAKELETNVYLVRNNKVYINKEKKSYDIKYLKKVYDIIYSALVESMKTKACKIALPEGINLTLPTSEKSFSGNYPLGTSIDLADKDAIIGINWRGEDGAQDLDLSLITIDGTKYGWNAAYTNSDKSAVYSGDMTSANPEATELFYARNGFTPSTVSVNLYRGETNSKFRFFIAKEKRNLEGHPLRHYDTTTAMVDPNNIIAMFDAEMESNQKQLGILTGTKFILAQFRTGNGIVSRHGATDGYTSYAMQTLDCYLNLKDLLVEAGFEITIEEPVLDLTNLSKDSLISLLA